MKNYPGQRRSPARTPLPAAAARASVPRPARGLCAYALRARSLAIGLRRSRRARGSTLPRSLHQSVHPVQAVFRVPTFLAFYLGPFLLSLFSHCSQSLSGFPSVFSSLYFCFVLLSLSSLYLSLFPLSVPLSNEHSLLLFPSDSCCHFLVVCFCLFLHVPKPPLHPLLVSLSLYGSWCLKSVLGSPCLIPRSPSLWVLPSLGLHASQSTPTLEGPASRGLTPSPLLRLCS